MQEQTLRMHVKGHLGSYELERIYCCTDWNLCSRFVFMKIKENGWIFTL